LRCYFLTTEIEIILFDKEAVIVFYDANENDGCNTRSIVSYEEILMFYTFVVGKLQSQGIIFNISTSASRT